MPTSQNQTKNKAKSSEKGHEMPPAVKAYLKEKDTFKETLAAGGGTYGYGKGRSDENTAEVHATTENMEKDMEEHQKKYQLDRP